MHVLSGRPLPLVITLLMLLTVGLAIPFIVLLAPAETRFHSHLTIGPAIPQSPAEASQPPTSVVNAETGTLTLEKPAAYYEVEVKAGVARINITLTNKGPTSLSVKVAVLQKCREYVPWIGEVIEYWDTYYSDSLWISRGETENTRVTVFARENATLRISLRVSEYYLTSPVQVDYEIEVEQLISEDELHTPGIGATSSYDWPKTGKDIMGFKIEVAEGQVLNLTIKQTVKTRTMSLTEARVYVDTSDLDAGVEKIEVYLNGEHVADIVSEDAEVSLPVEKIKLGDYNTLGFVYRAVGAGADGLWIWECEIDLIYEDDYHYQDWILLWAFLYFDGDSVSTTFYAPKRTVIANIYYDLYSLDTGECYLSTMMSGNMTRDNYVYLPNGTYCLIAERSLATDTTLELTLETIPIEIIEAGDYKDFTFHSDSYTRETFFVGVLLEEGWVYRLELDRVSGDGWWASGADLRDYDFYVRRVYSSALDLDERIYLAELWFYAHNVRYYEDVNTKTPEYGWEFRAVRTQEITTGGTTTVVIQDVISDDRSHPLLVFSIAAMPYGAPSDTFTVRLKLTKDYEIETLEPGEAITVSGLNATSGPCTRVFKLPVEPAKEYLLEVTPTHYEEWGYVSCYVFSKNKNKWVSTEYSDYAINTTLTLEYVSDLATDAYVYVRVGGDTTEIQVKLADILEPEPFGGEATMDFGVNDKVKLYKLDVKEGYTYVIEAEITNLSYGCYIMITFFNDQGLFAWEWEAEPPTYSMPYTWLGVFYNHVLANMKARSGGAAYMVAKGSPGSSLRISIREERRPYERGQFTGLLIGIGGGIAAGVALGAFAMWLVKRREF